MIIKKQVPDDYELLDQMMKELKYADELYKPTNYWKVYEKYFLPELREKGLLDFRRRKYSILESFQATDPLIRGEIVPKIHFRGSYRFVRLFSRILWNNPVFPLTGLTNIKPEWVTSYFYSYVQKKFRLVKLELDKCPTSLFGNPEDIVEINNRYWSFVHLNHCSMIADTAPYIKFHEQMVICELGSGMGRSVEILAHLFPAATILLIDIPPQLYVSNQYLSAVFGERVVPYRKSASLIPDNSDIFYNFIKGKIIILPTWAMPKWTNLKIDLFWNSASFQEMEPAIVKNYLELVKQMAPTYIYINALPGGNYWGKWRPGMCGTKEPVLSQYYFDFLKDKYKLKIEYDTDYFLRINDYKSYIWEK